MLAQGRRLLGDWKTPRPNRCNILPRDGYTTVAKWQHRARLSLPAQFLAAKEALIKSPLRKSDPVSTIEIHLPLKSKSFLRHPSNLKFGQDFQLRLNQRFPRYGWQTSQDGPIKSSTFLISKHKGAVLEFVRVFPTFVRLRRGGGVVRVFRGSRPHLIRPAATFSPVPSGQHIPRERLPSAG